MVCNTYGPDKGRHVLDYDAVDYDGERNVM